MEQITRSPVTNTDLANHLRAVKAAHDALWAASTTPQWVAAQEASRRLADTPVAAEARARRFVRDAIVFGPGKAWPADTFDVTATGREFIAAHPAPIRKPRTFTRPALMGERALVAELAKAA